MKDITKFVIQIFLLFIFTAGINFYFGFSAGKKSCACGDLPPPDETIKQIKTTTI